MFGELWLSNSHITHTGFYCVDPNSNDVYKVYEKILFNNRYLFATIGLQASGTQCNTKTDTKTTLLSLIRRNAIFALAVIATAFYENSVPFRWCENERFQKRVVQCRMRTNRHFGIPFNLFACRSKQMRCMGGGRWVFLNVNDEEAQAVSDLRIMTRHKNNVTMRTSWWRQAYRMKLWMQKFNSNSVSRDASDCVYVFDLEKTNSI